MVDEVAGVRESALQFAHANGVPDRLGDDLRLAISEAVTNAGLGLGLALIARVADQVEHREPGDGNGFELWMCFRLDVA